MGAAAANYAGFWKRFIALLIDSVILGIVIWIVQLVLIIPIMGGGGPSSPGAAGALGAGMVVLSLVEIVGFWLYFALMESSAKQGTVGKMVMSIKVTDEGGQRITFGRATGRYFAKIVSSIILFIGYIMAAFTEKKQALHDIMAKTLVLNK
jgi:uncharacterized RDD family membrane protein YckC